VPLCITNHHPRSKQHQAELEDLVLDLQERLTGANAAAAAAQEAAAGDNRRAEAAEAKLEALGALLDSSGPPSMSISAEQLIVAGNQRARWGPAPPPTRSSG
jgi:hypothetical protein